MRALALGAKSCMIGRAYIHGLGAFGGPGVAKAIDLIANETGDEVQSITITSVEAVDWPDTFLGCPVEGSSRW